MFLPNKEKSMKVEELKALIGKFTQDGTVDFDELNKAINTEFDVLIDRKVTSAKESSKDEHVNEFIKSQGLDNVDQFTALIKNSKATATELSEKVTRYEQELASLKGEYEGIKSKNDEYMYMSKLSDVDPRYQKFVLSEIKGLINDKVDFDTAKESYLADNAHYLADTGTIITKPPKGGQPNKEADSITAILERKHGIKLD